MKEKNETKESVSTGKISKKQIVKTVSAAIILALANMLVLLMFWIMNRYDDVQFDQILYQIKSPIAGTNGDLMSSAIIDVVLGGVLLSGLQVLIYLLLSGKFQRICKKWQLYIKYNATRVCAFFKKHALSLASFLLAVSMAVFIICLGVGSFVVDAVSESEFIEDHYVNPNDVEIKFPEQKRNLIYIFLESMENTFADTSVGGKITQNFMPELSELAANNISFAGSDGKSGAYSYVGTRWTAAAMFAQTSGVIMKVPINFDNYGDDGVYMPGIVTLGDILEKEGYNQTLLVGSDAGFAARDVYFTEHGKYDIIDAYSLIEEKRLPEDYWEWWGFEDEKLFYFAREELTRVASEGKPFNFTMLTADTHFPDGYTCRLCGTEHSEQYSNVISCSSRQVYKFINWIKTQPFYENTTIVLSGDHLTMDPEYLAGIDENYIRTTYNCIINSPVEPQREVGREFGTFDMFPTTVAALGATIEGDRLGIGTNLFGNVPTLTEQYGYAEVEEQLQKKSEFYIETFYKYD
jgi:phosphoglycerol transferase